MLKWQLMGFFWIGMVIAFLIAPFIFPEPKAMFDPSVMSANYVSVPEKPTYDEFRKYVQAVFGRNSRVALAVAQAECNKDRLEWPVCVNSWWKEHSIGPFQINLKAHQAKVPGATWQEKEEWLADWRNNVIMSHKIFSDSGWYPWSVFTNKGYLKYL